MAAPHRARRLALQGLCCLDVQGEDALPLVEDFLRDSREAPGTFTAAREMLNQALEDLPACDDLLRRHARKWELSRLALVDRNILRLSVAELRGGRTPMKVIITEALRLAREFSSSESPRFINGVLDAVARELKDERE